MSDTHDIPEYYNTVMPYLILKDAEAFIAFVQNVFGAEVKMRVEDEGEIRHAEVMIGDSTIMIGQSGGPWNPQPAGLYVNVESADESCRKALDAGASTVMELSDEEYGRTCGVKDPNGNTWWITSQT